MLHLEVLIYLRGREILRETLLRWLPHAALWASGELGLPQGWQDLSYLDHQLLLLGVYVCGRLNSEVGQDTDLSTLI